VFLKLVSIYVCCLQLSAYLTISGAETARVLGVPPPAMKTRSPPPPPQPPVAQYTPAYTGAQQPPRQELEQQEAAYLGPDPAGYPAVHSGAPAPPPPADMRGKPVKNKDRGSGPLCGLAACLALCACCECCCD
jgi:hypothetical protein